VIKRIKYLWWKYFGKRGIYIFGVKIDIIPQNRPKIEKVVTGFGSIKYHGFGSKYHGFGY